MDSFNYIMRVCAGRMFVRATKNDGRYWNVSRREFQIFWIKSYRFYGKIAWFFSKEGQLFGKTDLTEMSKLNTIVILC